MKKKLFLPLLMLVALLGSAAAGLAQPLTVSLQAFKVVVAEGHESLVVAETAVPGDVIEYRALYANTGDKPLVEVAPEIPIPAGLTWLAETGAGPAPVAGSRDGKRFDALPLYDEAGHPVPAAEVRALRWSIPVLKPAETIAITVRATVNRATAL